MPTVVKIPPTFRKYVKNLQRKYPAVTSEVRKLVLQLESGLRPGRKISGAGHDVYKARLRNPSAGRGKSGGFRLIYYLKLADIVYLLAIYSKTEKDDISAEEIRQLVAQLRQFDDEI